MPYFLFTVLLQVSTSQQDQIGLTITISPVRDWLLAFFNLYQTASAGCFELCRDQISQEVFEMAHQVRAFRHT